MAPLCIAISFLLVTYTSATSFIHNPFTTPFSTLRGGALALTYYAPAPAPAPTLSRHTPILGHIVSHISTAAVPAPSPSHIFDSNIAQFIESNMIATTQKIETLNAMIETHLKSPIASPISKECLKQCQLVYQKASESAKNCISDLNANKMEDVEKEISAVAANMDTCVQCTNNPEFKKFGEWVKGITGDCLAKIQEFHS